MKLALPASILSACAVVAVASSFVLAQDEKPNPMQEYMKKFARYTQPGENHKLLERFIGKWDLEVQPKMPGMNVPPSKGSLEVTWLMPGRWIESRGTAPMFGMPTQIFSIMGYDNFKQSFVWTGVSSMDTAMTRFEGDMTQDQKSLIGYGTLDEYTTGEVAKMVKYAYRFVDKDKIVLEVHDLPIGETNTEVVEITYTRAK
jgi:hypothetical protein